MIDITSKKARIKVLIRASIVIFIFFFGCLAPGIALPAYVDVTLGASQKPTSQVFVFGPLQICSKATTTLSEGRYLLQVRGNHLELKAIKSDRQKLSGNQNVSSEKIYSITANMELKGLRNGNLKIERERAIRAYAGTILASISHEQTSDRSWVSHLMLINHVARADYVAGVCAAELPKGALIEAIKAQAVLVNCMLARCGALAVTSDTTQNAAYAGVAIGRPEIRMAAQAIGDSILRFAEQPIHPYFHSTCAGRTSRACDVFQLDHQSFPYLQSVECHYCKHSPFWKHTVSVVPWPNYAAAFGNCVPTVSKKDEAERSIEVSLCTPGSVNKAGRVVQPAYDFWIKLGQKFGWNVAPGNIFSLARKDDYLEIDSRGAGHGVGLCQWGAMGMAQEGKSYSEILHYYFPLTKLSK